MKILRNGLIFGIVFFLLSFLVAHYSFNFNLKNAIIISTPIAMAALIVNGAIYSRFTKSLKSLQAIIITLGDFEKLKLEAPANYMVDDHIISGKLFLTDKRLLFKSYHQQEYIWLLTELRSFDFHSSLFNTGGEFIIKDDKDNRLIFEVDELRKWKKELLKN